MVKIVLKVTKFLSKLLSEMNKSAGCVYIAHIIVRSGWGSMGAKHLNGETCPLRTATGSDAVPSVGMAHSGRRLSSNLQVDTQNCGS